MFGWDRLVGRKIVITRASIAHSYFTHRYLLKGEAIPSCTPCHCPNKVKHILFNCIDLCDTRNKYCRNVNHLKGLLYDILRLYVIIYNKWGYFINFRNLIYFVLS